MLGAVADHIAEAAKSEGLTMAVNLKPQGFPAASLDLAYLQDRIAAYYMRFRPPIPLLCELIGRDVGRLVQRVKSVRAESEFGSVHVEVLSKDDFGWYTYRFSVPLEFIASGEHPHSERIRELGERLWPRERGGTPTPGGE
ncbi:MAG: hypothetical protein QI223_07175 [Candidatus Korarchaeota archaeon]|nr:hypothetical protein [Candidatus Korarchaeota archaeon]